MLRSYTKLTGALCLFAYATIATAPGVLASDTGSEPILHVIDTGKKKEEADAAAPRESVGSGSEPILHIIGSGNNDDKEKDARSSGSKSKASAKAKQADPKKSVAAKKAPAHKEDYTKLIRKAASKHGVPIEIAQAVVEVESNYNPRARGRAGEIGLMQIKPATARGIGYRGSTKALYDPETNLEWGMRYLAGAHEKANGDLCGTILRYNAGHYAKRMNSHARRYCTKVKSIISSS